jgi:putative PIN family toxin of toxin-antitoxin system
VGVAPPRNRPPRIFLDSNVIFSGLHSPGGPPGSILRHMIDHRIMVVISRQILDEVVGTIKKKFPQALPALNEFLLNSPLELVIDPDPAQSGGWTDVLSEGDASILAAAVAANPDYFITGDSHFLANSTLSRKSGLAICSPAQLLETLGLKEID